LIRAGDCYQVNLATRLSSESDAASIDVALRLWDAAGPARNAAYVGLPGGTLISASPERLLAVRNGVALSEPIKGTAPLGADPGELMSDKNRAEHVMIVDLVRNDLGRVARRGGVRVDALMVRRPTPYVGHLVSEVRAELMPSTTVGQIVRAVFPGGSVTGAPKVRAMEVIRELEPVNRGPAYGSVIAIGTDGSLDASVSIRTAWLAEGRVDYWAGGAIVWDSEAEAELAEAMLKARPFIAALAS
jgi:anthranilate/para-aminobenzoate synthase component I